MSSSSDMKQMNQAVKAQFPDMKGNQYADCPPGAGVTPISVSYDQFGNEITTDQPNHTDTTAGMGGFNWSGNQYDDSPAKGGFSSYGVMVADNGKNPQVERTSVDTSRADRGKES